MGRSDMQPPWPKSIRPERRGDQLPHPKGVTICDQHHRDVPMAVAVAAGGDDEAVDLGLGQILAGP